MAALHSNAKPAAFSTSLASFQYVIVRHSRYDRLLRAVGYLFRYVNILTAKIQGQLTPTGVLTLAELNKAEFWLVRVAQANCFPDDLNCLYEKKSLSTNSSLNSLNPLIENNILRVGGRLENSALSFDKKHPIILRANHRLCDLLIRHTHIKFFHTGQRLILSILQSKYWFIGNISTRIQNCIRACARCIRLSAAAQKAEMPVMGNLPAVRVQVAPPFLHVGIDYAGPFSLRTTPRSTRGTSGTIKGYFCVFVCMVTKAVHLEAVSALTTEAFIATLQRFSARRGLPYSITSDNGTNFKGADAALTTEFDKLHRQEAVQNFATNQGISWKFNPPSAPHMGGLFEAAVKSTKFHLRRVIGTQILMFEEFNTLLTQIEAILNSRPISPMPTPSTDTMDVLTPGHFLIGRPLIAVPTEWIEPQRLSISQRWRLITQLRNSFWHQWRTDYLHSLQRRVKWQRDRRNFQIDDIVILRDEQTPPLTWPLARIIETFPGRDGVCRVVNVQCRNGSVLRRPVAKLIPLVIDAEISTHEASTAAE